MLTPKSKSEIRQLMEAKAQSECEGCRFATYVEETKTWECRAHPPTVSAVLSGQRDHHGNITLAGTVSVFPMAMIRCGEFVPSLAIARPS